MVPGPRAKELRLAAAAADDLRVSHCKADNVTLELSAPQLPMPASKCCYDLGKAHQHRAASLTCGGVQGVTLL